MSKKWTQSEFRAGRSLSPKLVNDELRAQQSSATTIDRSQVPGIWIDEAYVQTNALHQVWTSGPGLATGYEQDNERDTDVPPQGWISSTIPTMAGSWRTLTSQTLEGFKGGSLFIEWSCNVYVNNIFAFGINDGYPGTPQYINMRILVNGVNLAERRGGGFHQTSRIFGSSLVPPGDLTMLLQWKTSTPSQDAAEREQSAPANMPYAHLWNNRWIAIARYR